MYGQRRAEWWGTRCPTPSCSVARDGGDADRPAGGVGPLRHRIRCPPNTTSPRARAEPSRLVHHAFVAGCRRGVGRAAGARRTAPGVSFLFRRLARPARLALAPHRSVGSPVCASGAEPPPAAGRQLIDERRPPRCRLRAGRHRAARAYACWPLPTWPGDPRGRVSGREWVVRIL